MEGIFEISRWKIFKNNFYDILFILIITPFLLMFLIHGTNEAITSKGIILSIIMMGFAAIFAILEYIMFMLILDIFTKKFTVVNVKILDKFIYNSGLETYRYNSGRPHCKVYAMNGKGEIDTYFAEKSFRDDCYNSGKFLDQGKWYYMCILNFSKRIIDFEEDYSNIDVLSELEREYYQMRRANSNMFNLLSKSIYIGNRPKFYYYIGIILSIQITLSLVLSISKSI